MGPYLLSMTVLYKYQIPRKYESLMKTEKKPVSFGFANSIYNNSFPPCNFRGKGRGKNKAFVILLCSRPRQAENKF